MNNSSIRLPTLAALAAAVSLAVAAPLAQADDKAYAGDRDSSQPVTDTWITTKVKSTLLVDGDVGGTDIGVETVDGVVTLTGTVDSKAEHDRAVAETRGIEGVVRVDHSGLIVAADRQARRGTMAAADTRTAATAGDRDLNDHDSDQPVTDTWITTKVKSTLLVDGDVGGLDIGVETVNGVVTLTGTVESKAELDRAVAETRGIEGVVRVDHSGVIVAADRQARRGTMAAGDTRTAATARERDLNDHDSDQPVTDTWITTKVKSSLLVDGDVGGTDIGVETVNGVVTLTGTVESKAEHDRAVAETRGIEGVVRVDHSGLIVAADRQARTGTMAAGDARTATAARGMNEGGSDQPVTDTWITTKVKSTLVADSEIDGSEIDVSTENGVVTLVGVLESQAAVDKAIAETRAINGVTSVNARELSARALSSR